MTPKDSHTGKVPCYECGVSCCSAYNVIITAFDFLAIRRALKLPSQRIVDFIPLEKENQNYFPFSFFLSKGKRFLLSLKKRGKSCIFLIKFGKYGRCGIHLFRPMVCRCYPFQLVDGYLHEVNGILCPTCWKLSSAQTRSFSKDLKKFYSNYEKYQGKIRQWNEVEFPRWYDDPQFSKDEKSMFRKFLSFVATDFPEKNKVPFSP